MHISANQLRRQGLHRQPRRSGVVLLVVIAMLALFATVGLTFVFYAESVSLSARYNRNSVTSELRDIAPDRILSQFLSQLLFDTDDTQSQLYGLSLGRNMYGGPGSRFAYSGTGYDVGVDQTSGLQRTILGPTVAPTATNPNPPKNFKEQPEFLRGKSNAPYTYPDINNPYLAAIDGDGKVIYRSFSRKGGILRANINRSGNANEGDVRNIEGGRLRCRPQRGGGGTFINDAFWVDCNLTGQTKDGLNYKIMIAPTIVDLDGRVNLTTAGTSAAQGSAYTSRGGLGPWEINPRRLVDSTDSSGEFNNFLRLFNDSTVNSRFGKTGSAPLPAAPLPAAWFQQDGTVGPMIYDRFPMFGNEANYTVLPGPAELSSFPTYGWSVPPGTKHPAMFDPLNAIVGTNSASTTDRRFAASNTEALLRYGEIGTPAITSDIFRCLGPSLDPSNSNAAHRALLNKITTFNMSMDVPHMASYVSAFNTYKMPLSTVSPGLAGLDPRPQASPPYVNETKRTSCWPKNARHRSNAATAPAFLFNLESGDQVLAIKKNQAKTLFAILRNITGLNTSDPTTWKFSPHRCDQALYKDANGRLIDIPTYKYVAQLAVNIVDYIGGEVDAETKTRWKRSRKIFQLDRATERQGRRLRLRRRAAAPRPQRGLRLLRQRRQRRGTRADRRRQKGGHLLPHERLLRAAQPHSRPTSTCPRSSTGSSSPRTRPDSTPAPPTSQRACPRTS